LVKRLFSCFLLTIFLGFYASITLFSHTHIINGVTIVHSHAYKTGKDGKPISHNHSEKEYSLIQLLSNITTTFATGFVVLGIILLLLYRIIVLNNDDNYLNLSGNCTYSLRAPPVR